MGRIRLRSYTHVYPEEKIESEFIRAVSVRGGCTWKFTSPGRRGVPDRLVLMPDCGPWSVNFVELKAPGEHLRPEQEDEHERMKSFGANIEVIDSYSAIADYFTLLRRFNANL
jgi:hypothetical protein